MISTFLDGAILRYSQLLPFIIHPLMKFLTNNTVFLSLSFRRGSSLALSYYFPRPMWPPSRWWCSPSYLVNWKQYVDNTLYYHFTWQYHSHMPGEFYGHRGQITWSEYPKDVFVVFISLVILHNRRIYGTHETTQVITIYRHQNKYTKYAKLSNIVNGSWITSCRIIFTWIECSWSYALLFHIHLC